MLDDHLALDERLQGVRSTVDGDLDRLLPRTVVDSRHTQLIHVVEPSDCVGVERGARGVEFRDGLDD